MLWLTATADSEALTTASPPRSRTIIWLTAFLLALALHLAALFWAPRFEAPEIQLPPRVDLQMVDPAKLAAIKKQWEGEKQLLLAKDKSPPKEKVEPPPDAKYQSDRNIRVAKEQRARETNVIPKSGRPGPPAPVVAKPEAAKKAEAPKPIPAPRSKAEPAVPKVGTLGVNYQFEKRSKEATEKKTRDPKLAPDPTAIRGGEDGGDQAIRDRALPEGSENLLNAQESVFYSFYSRLYEAIAPLWQARIRDVPRTRRVRAGEYNTVVEVVFDAQGNLLAIRHLEDSGIEEFDRAVDAAWKAIGRFPNPPKGLQNAQGRVHTGWTFSVHVGEGFQLQFLPPERNY